MEGASDPAARGAQTDTTSASPAVAAPASGPDFAARGSGPATSASDRQSPEKHALEQEERDAKRAKLDDDAGPSTFTVERSSRPPSHPHTPAIESQAQEDDAEGEAEIESDHEHEHEHEDGHHDGHEHDADDHAAPSSRASPDQKPKGGKEKKKRVRTEAEREREREKRRERDRARRARERAEREEAAAKAKAEAAKADKEPKGGASKAQSEENDEIYCVCKGANDEDGGTMIGCETCDNWFHPGCVGIDEDQVDMLDVYICANCESTTTRRTSYRRVCRNGCGRAARSTSKFCSSRCAFAHARSQLANVDKKDAKELRAALAAYPSPAPSVTTERPSDALPNGDGASGEEKEKENEKHKAEAETKARQVVEAAQDTSTLALLSNLRRQSSEAERALAVLARRQAILGSAIAAWESLMPAGSVEEPKKKSKNKRRDGEKDPRPCGFDSRIVWSDREVEAWDGSERVVEDVKVEEGGEGEGEGEGGGNEEGENLMSRAAKLGLCSAGRRCERHQGWQKTVAVALEVEAAQLTRRRDDLATLSERIERAGATTVSARRARDAVHAALEGKAK